MSQFWSTIFFFLLISHQIFAMRYDCCLPKYSSTGLGCESDITVGNLTYYCVSVAESCTSCSMATNLSSDSCYQCCATASTDCGLPFSYISTSSWTLICIIFAGSCCCCSIVFLSAEQSRIKEGITFREAYLLPIPIVSVETEVDDEALSPDQPTAIARVQTSINIPIAEPTENSGLNGLYDRDWD